MNVEVAVSNRHVHLTEDVWKKLFGDLELNVRNELRQPGQFASTSVVDIMVNGVVKQHVRVVGPFRSYNQVEIMESDAKVFGVMPPRRQSGDLDGSLSVTLIGPNGEVNLDNGLILAECHIHMPLNLALENNLEDKQEVKVYKNDLFVMNSRIKVSNDAYLEMHVDKDEEVLYDLHQGDLVKFEVCGK